MEDAREGGKVEGGVFKEDVEDMLVLGLITLQSGSEGVSGRWFLVRAMPYFGQRDSEST